VGKALKKPAAGGDKEDLTGRVRSKEAYMLVYARCALLALYWPQPVVLKRRRRAPDVGCGRARGCRRGAGTDSGDGGDVPAELRREVEEANLRMLEVRARPSMRRAGCVGPMEIETCNRRSTMLKSKKRRRCAVRAVLGRWRSKRVTGDPPCSSPRSAVDAPCGLCWADGPGRRARPSMRRAGCVGPSRDWRPEAAHPPQ
jgi:hypothetical protein